MDRKEFLSIPQAAKILGVSRITVYKRVKKGQLKAMRIGKNFAIPAKYVLKKIKDIKGRPLQEEDKRMIRNVVKRTVDEYGETLKQLGDE